MRSFEDKQKRIRCIQKVFFNLTLRRARPGLSGWPCHHSDSGFPSVMTFPCRAPKPLGPLLLREELAVTTIALHSSPRMWDMTVPLALSLSKCRQRPHSWSHRDSPGVSSSALSLWSVPAHVPPQEVLPTPSNGLSCLCSHFMPIAPRSGSRYFPSEAKEREVLPACPEFPKEIVAEPSPKSSLCLEPRCPLPSLVPPLVNFLGQAAAQGGGQSSLAP